MTLPSQSGRFGRSSSSSCWSAWARSPSIVRRNMNVAPADQACGEHATGYGTGIGAASRSKPQNSSGNRNASKCWAASKTSPTIRLASSWKP